MLIRVKRYCAILTSRSVAAAAGVSRSLNIMDNPAKWRYGGEALNFHGGPPPMNLKRRLAAARTLPKRNMKRKLEQIYSGAPPGPSNPKKLMSVEAARYMKVAAEIRAGYYNADAGYHAYYKNFSVFPKHRRKQSRPLWLPYVLKGRSRSERPFNTLFFECRPNVLT